jgi:hypothetical protein
VVDVVVLVVVVVVGPHGGVTEPSQEQSGFVLQLATTDFLHSLNSLPAKAPHAELISSEQTFGLHFPAALASEKETKTPAPSATAANVTTALLVIVEPPYWPFPS